MARELDAWRLLAELVGLLGMALALGLVVRRLRQMAVIGYLLAGLIAGPEGLGIVRTRETVEFLAGLGVALLLFSIGLEFSWQRIGALGRRSAIAGMVQFGLTWAAGAAGARWLGLGLETQFVTGNVLALSSTAFLVRILQDRSEVDSRHGRLAFGISLLQDLLLIPLLVAQTVVGQRKGGYESLAELGEQLIKGALLVGLFYVLVRLVVLRVFRGADTYAEREVPVILSVLVAFGCAWGSHIAGLSPVLGAFIAGLFLADQPVAAQVRANTGPFQAVFFTLFFTSIGMLTGLPEAGEAGTVLGLAAGIIAVKLAMAALALHLTGCSWRVAIMGGVTLAQIGEFSFVLARDGLARGLLPEKWFEPLVAASVLSLFANPYLVRGASELLERRARKQPAATLETEEGASAADAIVIGYGPAGRGVTQTLVRAGVEVVVIESNPLLARTASGCRVVVGDGTQAEILKKAGIAGAKLLVLTVPDPGVARTILGVAKQMKLDLPVVVRARYHRYAEPLRRLGAEAVVDEEHEVGQALARVACRKLGLRI